jgi:hypothetical protein
MVDITLRHLKHAIPTLVRPQRIGSDAVDRNLDRPPGGQRGMKASRSFRLDSDHLHPPVKGARHAADQAAAANGDQHRIKVRRLLQPFERDGALPGHGFPRIEGMHRHCAGLGHMGVAGVARIAVKLAADNSRRAPRLDRRNLHSRRDFRNEDPRLVAERARRMRHRDAVIAAGRGRNARRRHVPRQEIVERPARLERSAMLEQFELERGRLRLPEQARLGLDHRRASDMGRNAPPRGFNIGNTEHEWTRLGTR